VRFARGNQGGGDRGRRRDKYREKKYDSSNLMFQSNPSILVQS
jgi:hypothetical protein